MPQYSSPSNDSVDFTTRSYTAPSNDGVDFETTSAPSTPQNLAFINTTTEDELTLDWDEGTGAAGYYVYRAESSGSVKSDYTQVADVTAPPHTDTGLDDGERYYYRVSSHD